MSRRAAVITLSVTFAVAYGALAWTLATNTTPRLGLDLQGGFSVVLDAPEGTDVDVLEQAIEIMRRRIEALGDVQEPEISLLGERSVEVQLPGVTDRERALAAVGTTGSLEFRPVLTVSPIPGVSPIFLGVDSGPGTTTTTTIPEDDAGEDTTPTVPEEEDGEGTTTTTVPDEANGDGDGTAEPTDPTEGIVLPEGVTWCDEVEQPGCVDRETGLTVDPDPDLEAFMTTDFATAGGIVYHVAPARVVGADLRGARSEFIGGGGVGGPLTSQWVVALDFNAEGAVKFQEVTRELAGFTPGDPRRQFAIVLDGIVQSAPQVAVDVDPAVGIPGGSAIITLGAARNQQEEAHQLSVVLRYGALPVALEQASVQSVSATLGADSLRAGLIAGIGGLALVAVAMLLYYRALGLVNLIGLSVFGSLLFVIFSVLGAWRGVTLTLAGVTGLIVSVGITADSYIVYFERIKEEVGRGRSLRAAIDHAFRRSFRTIVTASTLALVAAMLLFFLAIGAVKGFAMALGIATVVSVIVAVSFTRPAVSLLARTPLGEGGAFSIRAAAGRPEESAS
jgi:preprotein translocase subunit SecD